MSLLSRRKPRRFRLSPCISGAALKTYIPGKACQCMAVYSGECVCDADWTPWEVYALRLEVRRLRRLLKQKFARSAAERT